MKKIQNRRTLSLQRTTLRVLTESEMSGADGGTLTTRVLTQGCTVTTTLTTTRTSAVDACPSAIGCTTTGRGGTSVINPGGF